MLMAVLTLLWGCSSDEEEKGGDLTFNESAKPTWRVDWFSTAAPPDWHDPASTAYECSMNLLVELDGDAEDYSSNADLMSVFINGECRGVSYRNVLNNGKIAFLLHPSGRSEENGAPMELRYYCDQLKHLTISDAIPPFESSNLIDDTYQLVFDFGYGSTKYPYFTELAIVLPEKLPFTPTEDDQLAVFVGNECRGVGAQAPEFYSDWKVIAYQAQPEETVQVRYYSADKGGIYTITQPITLKGELQQEKIKF